METNFKNSQKEVILPGFRKGNVPIEIIKQKFFQTCYNKSLDELIKEITDTIIKEKNLSPIVPINIIKLNIEKPEISFIIKVEFLPKIKVENYKKFKIKKPIKKVTKEPLSPPPPPAPPGRR